MGEGDRPGAEEAAGRAWSHLRKSVVLGLISNILVLGFIGWALYYIVTHLDELTGAGPVGMVSPRAIWTGLAILAPLGLRRVPAIAGVAVLLGAGAGVAIRASMLDPSIDPCAPACLFRMATGWQCPGCGALRAIHLLADGRMSDALAMNPAVFILAPVAALAYLGSMRRNPDSRRRARRAAWWVVAAMLAFGVVRNIA